ncbi:outer membrane protein TolC [Bradyrhizobium diazoefficiens]
MTQHVLATVMRRSLGSASRTRRAARWLVVLCLAAGSGGCVLTQDLPDPALDVPTQYKYAGKGDTPPSLDWWRGFRSAELTQLMEEAQTVNLDIAAAVSRIVQADAQARQAGAALLPSVSTGGSETYSRTSGSSSSGLTNGGREVVNYSASLSASYQLDFWRPESRRTPDRGGDSERQPFRS